jgi:hypothetical protein
MVVVRTIVIVLATTVTTLSAPPLVTHARSHALDSRIAQLLFGLNPVTHRAQRLQI